MVVPAAGRWKKCEQWRHLSPPLSQAAANAHRPSLFALEARPPPASSSDGAPKQKKLSAAAAAVRRANASGKAVQCSGHIVGFASGVSAALAARRGSIVGGGGDGGGGAADSASNENQNKRVTLEAEPPQLLTSVRRTWNLDSR